MEWKNSVQICITTFILAVIICKISAFPADYDQGKNHYKAIIYH